MTIETSSFVCCRCLLPLVGDAPGSSIYCPHCGITNMLPVHEPRAVMAGILEPRFACYELDAPEVFASIEKCADVTSTRSSELRVQSPVEIIPQNRGFAHTRGSDASDVLEADVNASKSFQSTIVDTRVLVRHGLMCPNCRRIIEVVAASSADMLTSVQVSSSLLPTSPPLKHILRHDSWLYQILRITTDIYALLFASGVMLPLALGYMLNSYGSFIFALSRGSISGLYFIGGGIMHVGIVCGLAAIPLAAVMINQTVASAQSANSLFQRIDLTAHELIAGFLNISVSGWVAMIPGLVVGQLLVAWTGLWWMMLLSVTATLLILAPIGILAVFENGSPIQFISPDVIQSLRSKLKIWLHFYKWGAIWVSVFYLSMFFRLLPGYVMGNVLCAAIQAIVILLFGRTICVLAQRLYGFDDGQLPKTEPEFVRVPAVR